MVGKAHLLVGHIKHRLGYGICEGCYRLDRSLLCVGRTGHLTVDHTHCLDVAQERRKEKREEDGDGGGRAKTGETIDKLKIMT